MVYNKEYMKEYYKKNKEKLLKNKKKWKEDNPDKVKVYRKKYREVHKDRLKEYNKKHSAKHRAENPEKYREYQREYQKKYRKMFGDKVRECLKIWRSSKEEKLKVKVRNKIRSLHIEKIECSVCSSNKHLEYHHQDYNKPLHIAILCRSCHNKVHKIMKIKACDVVEEALIIADEKGYLNKDGNWLSDELRNKAYSEVYYRFEVEDE